MKIRDWYFQGWERRPDENGKQQLIYTGEVYSFPNGMKPVRMAAGLHVGLLTILVLLVSLLPTEGGRWHWAAVPQLLELIPLLYLWMGLVRLLLSHEPMTYRAWHASVRRLLHASVWSLVFTGLMVLVQLIYLFTGPTKLLSELLYLAELLCCAALSLHLFRYLRTHPYEQSAQHL